MPPGGQIQRNLVCRKNSVTAHFYLQEFQEHVKEWVLNVLFEHQYDPLIQDNFRYI